MTIQFNTDKNITVSEKFDAALTTLITSELTRFSDHITRLEVHISDENGGKEGPNDKRCMIEARLEGLQPIAVTSHGESPEHAVKVAVTKLKAALDTVVGRLKSH